jgi:hypothetical protein
MEYKDVVMDADSNAGFYFELHFHFYNEKGDKESLEETGRPVL